MIQRWYLLFVVPVATLLLAADEEAVLASIVDNNSSRIPTHTVAPSYPRKARRDRVEGEVQVCFDVNRKGRPRRVAVRKSTHRAFERPSIKAVKASTFRPLEDDQELPLIKSCRTFVFSLQPVEK